MRVKFVQLRCFCEKEKKCHDAFQKNLYSLLDITYIVMDTLVLPVTQSAIDRGLNVKTVKDLTRVLCQVVKCPTILL